MTSHTYQAVGVVEGTFVPERDIVIGADGTTYPASCHPGVRRFFERKPKEAAKAKFLVCWPRTSDTGKQVHLTVTSAPADPERQASLKREAGRFKVSGVITNQRSRLNRVVVRVVRNVTVPRKRRHEPQFKTHLLFLTGRAAPFGNFVNKHTTFTCSLEAHQLRIRGIEDTLEPEVVFHEAGGLKFPWPFRATQKHVELFAEAQGVGKGPFLVPDDARDRLQLRLRNLDLLVAERKDIASDVEQLNTDRILKVRQRIHNFTRRMGDQELRVLLESTGLLTALAKLRLAGSSPNHPEHTMSAIAEPAVALPKNLQKVADLLVAGAPDALMSIKLKIDGRDVKAAIAALMSTDGWWDGLPEEEQARARRGSYQIRKILKQRG